MLGFDIVMRVREKKKERSEVELRLRQKGEFVLSWRFSAWLICH